MVKKFKALLGLAAREDATTEELAPGLPAAEAELVAAREAQAAVEAEYRASLLSENEAETHRLDDEVGKARVRIARAEALVEALRDRLTAAREREAEVDRIGRFEEVRRQADDAARALAELYPQLAHDLVNLIEVVAQADLAVMEVNADLPRGAEPLSTVEGRVRDLPGLPEKILSVVEVKRWVRVGQIIPGSFDQDAVRPAGGGRGHLPIAGQPLSAGHSVELRQFVERQSLPATYVTPALRLAQVLTLPGLREGEPAFFTPVERPFQGAFDVNHVLGRIAQLRGQSPQGEPTRTVTTTLVPLDKTPVQTPPAPPSHQEVRTRY